MADVQHWERTQSRISSELGQHIVGVSCVHGSDEFPHCLAGHRLPRKEDGCCEIINALRAGSTRAGPIYFALSRRLDYNLGYRA